MTPGIVPVSLGVDNGSTGPALCYSNTPTGSATPEAVGGKITVLNPTTTNSVGVKCEADRGSSTAVALDCLNRVNVDDDPAHNGTSVSATVQVATVGTDVGRTGTEGNDPVVTINPPRDSDLVTGVTVDNFACVWATGPGLCPVPFTDADVQNTGQCLVHVNTSCT